MTKDKTTKDMADSVNEREIVLDILLELNRPEAMSHLVIGAALKKYQYLLKHQRSFITRLAQGTLERRIELDYIINQYSKTPVRKMKPLFADSSRVSQVKEKGTCDYVTQVDIQVQKLVKEGLYSMYPQVQFMGEEQDNSAIDRSGDFWILDPVDGTTNLIHDFRHSTLSLAYAEAGEVVLGIVYQPYTDELFIAKKGEGAFLNGDPIHVSGAETLSESLVTIGTSPYYHELADWNFKVFKEVFLSCQDIRRLGSAALDMAYVACGRVDVFFEAILQPWDFSAAKLLIEEAGGKVTDFAGKELPVGMPGAVLAGNGKINEELLRILSEK